MPPDNAPQTSLPQNAAPETPDLQAHSVQPIAQQTSHLLKKPIKVVEANATAIEDALATANGKAASFALTTASEIIVIARMSEQRIADLSVRSRTGVTVQFTPAGPAASSYKCGAISTEVVLERRGAGWYLIGVRRTTLYPRARQRLVVNISRAQADEITRRALSAFVVAA